jgi:hypothetical protein
MSLFVRCEWIPSNSSLLEECIEEAVGLLSDSTIMKIIGTKWYFLGNSKAEALSNQVTLGDISRIDNWRQVHLSDGVTMHRLNLWNGQDYPRGANVSLAINVPSGHLNTFVISSLDTRFLHDSGVLWETILLSAKHIAERLGGLALVSSDDLLNLLKERSMKATEQAAYGAFWGMDRSGKNPRYSAVRKRRVELPFSYIVCDCWEKLQDPDGDRLEEIVNLLEDKS